MGVTILAILAFINGVVGILFGGLGALFGGALGAIGAPAAGGLVAIWGLLSLVVGVAWVYVGWGFWRLVKSSWRFGIFVAAASILVTILVALFGGGGINIWTIVGIAITIAVIYYLLTPEVKAAFGITGDLQTAVLGGMGSTAGGAGAAATSPPPAPPAEPPAAPPPAAPPPAAPAAEPPASSWTGDSSGGAAPSAGSEDTDQNA
jgi:hypothetical protein